MKQSPERYKKKTSISALLRKPVVKEAKGLNLKDIECLQYLNKMLTSIESGQAHPGNCKNTGYNVDNSRQLEENEIFNSCRHIPHYVEVV